ncbi:hypothetical protein [Burkholderia cenocepacia]|uniref:hypothetical protein n=1 Tax=Burkholderia cenocepacia TaxID=95486 RepID=UPI00264AAE98|nr:hypothetical protein [Burkholderia cenocepacia]MDN7658421.1 hypothetical protein [Burkholderia cenocepacia]
MPSNVLVPDRLNRFPEILGFVEPLPASGYFEDQATHLVAVRVAAPYLAQFTICR